jgi:hypothetical protein
VHRARAYKGSKLGPEKAGPPEPESRIWNRAGSQAVQE